LLLFFLTFLPVAYYVLRKLYGHSIASRTVVRLAQVAVVFQVALLWILNLPGDYGPRVVVTGDAIVALLLARSLIRWPFRARWAGPLLLDLTSKKDRGTVYIWASISAVFALLLAVWTIHLKPLHTLLDERLIAFPFFGLVIGYAFCCAGRVELRQRGIIISGLWLRWSKIEAYAWEDTGREFVALKVRSRKWLLRLLAFSPTLEIILPAAQKSSADAILKSQLSEWPDESVHAADKVA